MPSTRSGQAALALFVLAFILLLARIAHIPPLSYLFVLITAGAAGLVAIFAVIRHERSAGVLLVLVVGALAGAIILLETLNPPG